MPVTRTESDSAAAASGRALRPVRRIDSSVQPILARGLSAVIFALSVWGLFSMRLGDYDDSLLVIGSRLVEAGKLPFVDFYSHYGPLGYTLFALLMRFVENPGLALRIAQCLLLLALTVSLHAITRKSDDNAQGEEGFVPMAVLLFSGAAAFPSFLGFAVAAAAVVTIGAAVREQVRTRRMLLGFAGGVLLALAALIRPSFAVYVGVAIALFGLVIVSKEAFGERFDLVAAYFGAALVTGVVVWLFLYREISPSVAFDATLVVPSRLVSNGSRYLEPIFLRTSPPNAAAICLALVAVSSSWLLALRSRKPNTRLILGVGLIALIPLVLKAFSPGRPLPLLGFLYLPVAFVLAYFHRDALRSEPTIAAAAAVGLCGAAYVHYFWSRADGPHLLPALALGASSAALVWGRLRDFGRLGIALLMALCCAAAAREWYEPLLPGAKALNGATVRSASSPFRLRCEEVPEDVGKAVSLADRLSSPESRFVGVASSHAATQSNPVVLFAISRRLPYTRWFQYDPGLQGSSSIQAQMERELAAAGSEAAVVWRADRFLVDRERPNVDSQTRLDSVFRRLYPRTVGKFGDYEVRVKGSVP